eukprot:tig00001215_g7575.t1
MLPITVPRARPPSRGGRRGTQSKLLPTFVISFFFVGLGHLMYPGMVMMSRSQVTLVLHLRLDQLQALEDIVQRWQGPVAAAVLTQQRQPSATVLKRWQVEFPEVRIAWVEVGDNAAMQASQLRARALDLVDSAFALVADIDFVPSYGLYEWLVRKATLQKYAYVIPAFEADEALGPREAREVPREKRELLEAVRAGRARPMLQHDHPAAHYWYTAFHRFYRSLGSYEIEAGEGYEPYVAAAVEVLRSPERGHRWYCTEPEEGAGEGGLPAGEGHRALVSRRLRRSRWGLRVAAEHFGVRLAPSRAGAAPAPHWRGRSGATLVLQAASDELERVGEIAVRWGGPVTAAVCVQMEEEGRAYVEWERKRARTRAGEPDSVRLVRVAAPGEDSPCLPEELVRAAVEAAGTAFLLVSHVSWLPSPDFAAHFGPLLRSPLLVPGAARPPALAFAAFFEDTRVPLSREQRYDLDEAGRGDLPALLATRRAVPWSGLASPEDEAGELAREGKPARPVDCLDLPRWLKTRSGAGGSGTYRPSCPYPWHPLALLPAAFLRGQPVHDWPRVAAAAREAGHAAAVVPGAFFTWGELPAPPPIRSLDLVFPDTPLEFRPRAPALNAGLRRDVTLAVAAAAAAAAAAGGAEWEEELGPAPTPTPPPLPPAKGRREKGYVSPHLAPLPVGPVPAALTEEWSREPARRLQREFGQRLQLAFVEGRRAADEIPVSHPPPTRTRRQRSYYDEGAPGGVVLEYYNSFYPLNELRAEALKLVASDLVLFVDPDTLPSAGMYEELTTAAATRALRRHAALGPVAFVVPAFETDFGHAAPADKAELLRRLSREPTVLRLDGSGARHGEDVRPLLSRTHPSAHYWTTNYTTWYAASAPYAVRHQYPYAPYVVAPLGMHQALLDVTPVGERSPARDVAVQRARWVAALRREGCAFLVLPDVFVTHVPLVPFGSPTPYFGLPLARAGITMTVHLTADRMERLEVLAERWPGPLVAVLFYNLDLKPVNGSGPTREQFPHTQLQWRQKHPHVSLGMLAMAKPPTKYPANIVRNAGLRAAQTDFVFPVDVDFVPDTGLHEFLDRSMPELLARASFASYIVPAFEIDANATQVWRDEDFDEKGHSKVKQDYRAVPQDKAELMGFVQNRSARPFREIESIYAHVHTQFSRWFFATREYRVRYKYPFEPWVVVAKDYAPLFDERFIYHGEDKVQWVFHISKLHFRLQVVPYHFVIHLNHPVAAWAATEYTEALFEEEAFLFETFVLEVDPADWDRRNAQVFEGYNPDQGSHEPVLLPPGVHAVLDAVAAERGLYHFAGWEEDPDTGEEALEAFEEPITDRELYDLQLRFEHEFPEHATPEADQWSLARS